MSWFIFILGIVLGAGGYYLYDKFSAKVIGKAKAEEQAVVSKIKRVL